MLRKNTKNIKIKFYIYKIFQCKKQNEKYLKIKKPQQVTLVARAALWGHGTLLDETPVLNSIFFACHHKIC